MHILVATHDYYPDPGSGGTGRYVAETARRLVGRGHRVSVVTRRRGDVPKREVLDGVDIYRYDLRIAQRNAVEIVRALPAAASTVADHVASAVTRAGSPAILSYQGPVTARLVERTVDDDGTARAVTFHSPWSTEYRLKCRGQKGTDGFRRKINVAVRRYIERRVLSWADCLVTLSEFMREETHRVHGRVPPSRVIPGGVDTARFTPAGQRAGGIDGDPAFLTVRRLSERMGHELLLEAFSEVVAHHPDAHLYIAGDGPLRNRLEAVARRHKVERATTFLGYVPDEKLPSVYRSADLFVLPTTELEGFGLVTLEALASGLPVVATPVGGTVEVLDGLATTHSMPAPPLVDDATPTALADGMSAWANLSTAQRATATEVCRRYACERFPWERTVSHLEALYETLAGTEPGHSQV